ncbi:hypothetical protein [Thiolapillus sp.]|uniref:hypothetical protein n=1 Tax=Thiolapillus sp. TaxID=2017437 RepID=UPI0025D03509|nr:hypothetical protein [Thiolapillus sp.]
MLLRTWLPYDWTPRSEAYFVFPLAQGTPGKQCGLAATGVYQPSLRSPCLAAKDVYMASFVRLSLFFFVTLYAWWTVALLDAWRHRRLRRKHRLTEEPA